MSVDITATCLKHKTGVHLGFLPWAFGHGSNDKDGHQWAIRYIENHCQMPPCDLRIVTSDHFCDELEPQGFREIEIGDEAGMSADWDAALASHYEGAP